MRSNTRKQRPALGYFVLGSVLLHALVVSLWHDKPAAGPMTQSSLQVTLLARHGNASSSPDSGGRPTRTSSIHPSSTAPPATPQTTGRAMVGSATRPAPRQVTKTAVIRPNRAKTTTPVKTEPMPVEPPAAAIPVNGENGHNMRFSAQSGSTSQGQHELTSAARHSRVVAALHKALLPQFNYPPLARRRGWQGRVNVGLHVDVDGDLTRIHLVKSSGHALLDRAAVRNITELRSIPGAAQWLGDSDMDVVLPVFYQLVEQ